MYIHFSLATTREKNALILSLYIRRNLRGCAIADDKNIQPTRSMRIGARAHKVYNKSSLNNHARRPCASVYTLHTREQYIYGGTMPASMRSRGLSHEIPSPRGPRSYTHTHTYVYVPLYRDSKAKVFCSGAISRDMIIPPLNLRLQINCRPSASLY